MSVENLWVGKVSPSSAWVRGKVTGTVVRLAVSTAEAMTSPTYTTATVSGGVASAAATGLDPDTQYHFAFEVDGILDLDWQGKFRTFPTEGEASSFTFAAASCASTVTNHAVFDTIREAAPLFFVHMGDLHYQDIAVDEPADFRAAYDDVLTANGDLGAAAKQGRAWRNVPIAYVWDDHDFGPNGGDKNNVSRPAARQVYRERVPHYDLPAASPPNAGIWQTFVCGRVRFILTDIRSERSPAADTDNSSKLMLGVEQEEWFLDLLSDSTEAAICWVNTMPWKGAASAGADTWRGYSTERQRIADHIASVDGLAERLFIISGDMHGLAIDDGSNNDWGRFPIFHFAGLDATASAMIGTPYSHGTSPGGGRHGTIEIDDRGDRIIVTGTGYIDGVEWNSYSFRIPRPPEVRRPVLASGAIRNASGSPGAVYVAA